ncbi:hypothetical protein QBC38DRAFT_507024 [Podospora fimiseda]|uniref:Apple domain-containing protein n=1 Tax=Podospora fimiseda TaxID=252190 RepID=A0AAN7BWJ4_9PEZI|nr:hypothetical protein QBC38DRAFT_507024 [Podospora fimiseda]
MTEPSNRQGSPSHLNSDSNAIDINHHRVRFAEAKSEPENTTFQPARRPSKTSSSAAEPLPPPPGPAVFWDDRDVDRESVAFTANTAQLEQYTFYREPTPPPADYVVQEKPSRDVGDGRPVAGSSSLGGAGSDRDVAQTETSNWPLAGTHEPPSKAKKRLFLVIVLIAILMIVGVAVGVGVGLTMSRRSNLQSADEAVSSATMPPSAGGSGPTPTTDVLSTESPDPSNTPTGTHATTVTSTTFSVASRPNLVNSDCPAVNNTIYQVPGSTQRFLRLCGIDYSGGSDARDVAQIYTASMIECIHACASFDQCTAAGWGYIAGDIGNEHRCFMKTDLKKSHEARNDWCFAILQT